MKKQQQNYFFYALVSLHVFFWTLVPALTRNSLPLDVMEGLTWGREWQWGYDKNPFLNAWVSEVFSWFGGASGWTQYLASQLSVAVCFWAVWTLAKKIVNPLQALASVVMLEGVYYFTIAAPQFNDNMLELALWPLAALSLYHALQSQRVRYWVLTGVFTGLAMMAKYYTAMLILGLFFWILSTPEGRQSFKRSGIYFAVLVFLGIIAPHVVWLFQHDFTPIYYAFRRAGRMPHWSHHIVFPMRFAAEQLLAFLPAVFLSLWFVRSGRKKKSLSTFHRRFLWCVGAGPFLLTLLLSGVKGFVLHSMWGVPLLSFFGVIFMAAWQPIITPRRFIYFFVTTLCVFFTVLAFYAVSMVASPFKSPCGITAYYPGPESAEKITALWHARYQQPLRYVAGPRWEAGNVAFFSKDRPSVYMEWNAVVSPWIDEAQLKKSGAVFVWRIKNNKNENLNFAIWQRFPRAEMLSPMEFHYKSCTTQLGVAILPPLLN